MDIFGMDPLYVIGGVILVGAVIYGFVLSNNKSKGNNGSSTTSNSSNNNTPAE